MRTPDPVAMTSAVPAGTTLGTPVPPPESPYWLFYDAVAAAQLGQWLPEQPARVLDVSGGPGFAAQLAAAGHEVVPSAEGLQDRSVDLVLAESSALSMCLATEVTLEHLARVLRPGGRLLLVVESLMLGLARLAEQGRWAELADAPAADVVLVPGDDGILTRCFWPEDLTSLLEGAGLDVEWVRPRTVLNPATVERALSQGGAAALKKLVATELGLAEDRAGESTGLHLTASAIRR